MAFLYIPELPGPFLNQGLLPYVLMKYHVLDN